MRCRPPARFALLLAVATVLAVPATAQARAVVVGVADQKPEMFFDKRFKALGLTDARRVVAWDALQFGWQRHQLDDWMNAAHFAGVQPLITFGRSRLNSRRKTLPTPAGFRRAFLSFKHRYPWVRTYSPWNEANHCSQPTCHQPRRAAAYYNVIRTACSGCTIVAADVLDQPGMVAWLREFRRHTIDSPRIWGLHNYLDVNRFRSSGTRSMLAHVKGEIWFTEVGGLVSRKTKSKLAFPESAHHAAAATKWMFQLTQISPRIGRLYVYNWNAQVGEQWDSALIGPTGNPRPAFEVLKREVAVHALR
jgi:hypothetical protein